jgi:hypothetical protein
MRKYVKCYKQEGLYNAEQTCEETDVIFTVQWKKKIEFDIVIWTFLDLPI